MFDSFTRRRFLQATAAGGAAIGLGDLRFLTGLPRVSADEVRPDPQVVRLQPEIEPLVRLLEETPRDKLLEEVAARIQRGMSYREVLAALLLAGVRNIQPRPVGFKFHAVLVVNSAHLASLAVARRASLAADLLGARSLQGARRRRTCSEGDWTMAPVDESAVPPADKARAAFCRGDGQAGTKPRPTRPSPAWPARPGEDEIFEIMFRYGCATSATSATRRSTWPTAAHAAVHRLAACRAGAAIAGLRPARSDKDDEPGQERLRRRSALAPQSGAGRRRSAATGWMGKPAEAATARDAGHAATGSTSRRPATRSSSCSTAACAPQSIWDALLLAARRAADAAAGHRRPARRDHAPTPCTSPFEPAPTTTRGGCCCCRTRPSSRCSARR